MTTITETEYETVEKEVTRVCCDSCHVVLDRNEAVGFLSEWTDAHEYHQCPSCSDLDAPMSLSELQQAANMWERKMLLGKLFSGTVALGFLFGPWALGAAAFFNGLGFWGIAGAIAGGYVLGMIMSSVSLVALHAMGLDVE